jgi:hypothetical protein
VGEQVKADLEARYHHDPSQRARAEAALARTAGLEPWEVIVYCPSLGMSLPEAEVPVCREDGRIEPLSESDNSEIRVLRDKHRALWKFLVLIDRRAWDRGARLRDAAIEYFGVTPTTRAAPGGARGA